jgi:Tol biopolymer transport system component
MQRVVLVVVLATAACGACGACGEEKPAAPKVVLPGTIWLVEDGEGGHGSPPTLVRVTAGTRTVIGRGLYPSTQQLPDGRLVAIASRGDGSATAEQLALVARDGRVERLGPAAAQIRDPAVDPQGRFVVVAASFDGHSDLYRIELGGAMERLTNNAEGNYRPTLAGTSIVYVSSRDGDSEIYRRSGSDDIRLTAFHRDDWEPTPSPDGATIAFLSDRDGTPRIYLMNPDATNLRRLTTHEGEESSPTWSADGAQLAYVMNGQVWVRDVARGKDRAVTPPSASELEPSFSPDGRWLAVARERDHASDVYATSLATGESVLVARSARLPRWMP